MKTTLRCIAVLLALQLGACASNKSELATQTYGVTADMFGPGMFQVPNSKLILFIDLPNLRKNKEKGDINTGYVFEGTGDRFLVTFFVEPPSQAGTTHQDVYDYYWPRASRNPLIDKSSVKTSQTDRYARVEYFYRGDFEGRRVNMKNVNYYALVKDRWIDVHVSVSNPMEADNAALANLDKKIAFTVLGQK